MVAVAAQGGAPPVGEQFADLTDLSLEQLLDVEVSLVSRRAQRIGDAPASVHVITRRDIERSGLTSIPELLRLVPGVQVQRMQAGRWAIGTRGQPGEFANNLLVLMDGRSVYTPLYSGVYWDMQDLVLDDIERIEVIRGPGGARWGANAVNGVINVVTRSAHDTRGSMVESIVGSEERAVFSFRHGAAIDDTTDVRVSGKVREQESTRDAADADVGDGYTSGLVDFRVDGGASDAAKWLLRGGMLSLDEETLDSLVSGSAPFLVEELNTTRGLAGHLLGRLELLGDEGATTTFQLYYDAFDRESEDTFTERRQTVDVEVQHAFAPWGDHQFTVGAGYRLTSDDVTGSDVVRADDYEVTNQLFSAFLLDEWSLCDGLWANFGVKLEHNDFTGFEVQPEVRLAWRPEADWLVWGAVSRAVRTPSRAEDSGNIDYRFLGPGPGGLPTISTVTANPDLDAERLLAFELGARGRISETVLAELDLYVHEYDDMVAYDAGAPSPRTAPFPAFVVPLVGRNIYSFRNSGCEASVTWKPDESWQLTGGYAYLDQHLLDDGGAEAASSGYGRHSRHQGILRIGYAASAEWRIDAQTFYASGLENDALDGWLRLDVGLSWEPDPHTRMSLVGQNLLDDRHQESSLDVFAVPTEIERSVHLLFSHRF